MKDMKLAKDMRARYQEDLKAGHTDAAEYWRGQASAYFTGNPGVEVLCAWCNKPFHSIKTSVMRNGKLFHKECYTAMMKLRTSREGAHKFCRRCKRAFKPRYEKDTLCNDCMKNFYHGTGVVKANKRKLEKNPNAVKVIGTVAIIGLGLYLYDKQTRELS